jgi:hypothetical protein
MKQINNQVKSVADIDRLENLSDFWAAVRKYIIVKVPERFLINHLSLNTNIWLSKENLLEMGHEDFACLEGCPQV